MGIKGLLSFLKLITKDCNIEEYRGNVWELMLRYIFTKHRILVRENLNLDYQLKSKCHIKIHTLVLIHLFLMIVFSFNCHFNTSMRLI